MPKRVDPHHLLLIGAGPGVGAGVVRRFGREGFRSTLISHSKTLDRLAPEMRSGGLEIEAIGADIEDLDGYRETLERIFSVPGAPGVVVYNAALPDPGESSTPRSSGSGPPTTSMFSAPSSRHR
jgi:NAD(P)-dependent dehydrogenase (short-subunit alcohol dehydrogenase family)